MTEMMIDNMTKIHLALAYFFNVTDDKTCSFTKVKTYLHNLVLRIVKREFEYEYLLQFYYFLKYIIMYNINHNIRHHSEIVL